MGNRTILTGRLRLSRAAFQRAQDTALLEMSVMAPDGIGVELKPVSAKALFAGTPRERQWARNAYDDAAKHWVFGVTLHDDALPNANTDALFQTLSALKDHPGTDFVVAMTEWNGQLERAWRIDASGGAELEHLPPLPEGLAAIISRGDYEDAFDGLASLLSGR